MPPHKFAYIDALRGYAILGVMVTHVGGAYGFSQATGWGARGVQLFFVVSAFTLALSWSTRTDGVAAFYVRRLFRIVPMFWLAIGYFLWLGASAGPLQLATAITLTHGLRPDTLDAIVPGGWSIADEVMFYWLFPIFALLLTSVWRAALALVLAFMAASWWYSEARGLLPSLFPSFPINQMLVFGYLAFPIQLAAFAAGFLAFNLMRLRWRPHAAALELGLVAALCWLAWTLYSDVHNVPLMSVIFGAVVALMALGVGGYLVNRVVRHIGKVSYSAYFIHIAVVHYTHLAAPSPVTPAGAVLAFLFVVPVTIALASVTYYAIERPMIRLGARLVRYHWQARTYSRGAAPSPSSSGP